MSPTPNVHDILGPLPPGSAVADDPAQQPLITACLQHSPYAVVRRTAPRHRQIPIGIRGQARNQRYAAWLAPDHLTSIIRPEDLRTTQATNPALETLLTLQHRWAHLPLPWGPTGSVGFALATGSPTITATSDLDLLLRARAPITPQLAKQLLADTQNLPARVDLQIETPLGAIALEELANNSARLMLRSFTGVTLVEDPWHEVAYA